MQETSPDRPNVIIFPPVILVATVALASLLQWLAPLAELGAFNQTGRVLSGVAFILAGVCLAAAGRSMLVRLGTNVSPMQPTTALATSGVYSWTRNPLYSGGTLVMLGLASVFAIDWLMLLILPSLLLLHFGVVTREERYLEQKFGDEYQRYKASVARYGLGM